MRRNNILFGLNRARRLSSKNKILLPCFTVYDNIVITLLFLLFIGLLFNLETLLILVIPILLVKNNGNAALLVNLSFFPL